MFKTRLISSIIIFLITIIAIYSGLFVFACFVGVIATSVFFEIQDVIDSNNKQTLNIILASLSCISIGLMLLDPLWSFSAAAAISTILFLCARVIPNRQLDSSTVAFIYATIPALLLILTFILGGVHTVLWFFLLVWSTDVGAYAAGKLIGGKKIAVEISPNKTWSGAIGGLISSLVVSYSYLSVIGTHQSFLILAIGLTVSIFSQIGDFGQSQFKRRYSVKDTGSIIPGHGGMFDRVDGLWLGGIFFGVTCYFGSGGLIVWQ